MVLSRTALAAAFVGSMLAGPALHAQSPPAGSIFGRVELLRGPSAPSRRPRVAALGGPPVEEDPDRRRAVVYLEEAPRRALGDADADADAEEPRAVLDQRNRTFVPHVLAVSVGTVVDFLNSDGTYHNVFSLSKAKRFDLGRYPRGQKKSVRFDRPGVVRVFCDIHSHMSAYILVFAHRFFAVSEDDGSFRITDVPPGTYTVVAWHDGEARASRQVQVPARGAVELDLQIR